MPHLSILPMIRMPSALSTHRDGLVDWCGETNIVPYARLLSSKTLRLDKCIKRTDTLSDTHISA